MALKQAVKDLLPKPKGKSKDNLWPFLKDRYDMGLELRVPFERMWTINLSFLAGKQYVFYNQAAELLQHLVQPKGRIHVVDNQIIHTFSAFKQIINFIQIGQG